MSPRPLELNCLVIGDDPSHLFTVKISDTESVSILKEEIWKKNPNAFNGVDANTLLLWKVSIFVDDNLQQLLKEFEPVEELALRRPVSKLSSVFPNLPEDEHLHILIQRPCECPFLVPSPRRYRYTDFPLRLPHPFATPSYLPIPDLRSWFIEPRGVVQHLPHQGTAGTSTARVERTGRP